VTIQSDASEKGLGGTLLQDGQPVAFTSRALTKTEQNYAQIEKEALAIVFSCERFNQYIHGRDIVTIKTDHKPLVPIFKKPIQQAPKRLQRMMLRLQKYTLDIQYQPGPQMYIADCLSRNYLKSSNTTETPTFQIFQLEKEAKLYTEIEKINQVDYLHVKTETIVELQQETAKDPVLQQLKQEVLTGWRDKNELPENIRQFCGYRDEITVQNGILYKGMRIIVPAALQKTMLKKVHSSHQGITASIRRAKYVLFWPGMGAQITDMISTCTACNTFQDKQQKEPMMSYEVPTRPWSILSQDLMSYQGETYLITVDHYSDFFEIDNVTEDTRSEAIIKCTKDHCSRHGRADKIITDNGPQFISGEYEQFMKEWKTEHVTISPHHSQSNGKAEITVKIAKSLLKKTIKSGQDFQLALLDWRNTPKEDGSSPVQKLMSRRTSTLLPTSENLLKPQVVEGVPDIITERKLKAKQQYDKTAKPLQELKIGERVRIQPTNYSKQWKPGVCTAKVGPRSYLVRTDEGQTYRRNRKFLRTSCEPADPILDREDFADDYDFGAEPENNQPAVPQERPPSPAAARSASTRSRSNIQPPARYKDFVMS
jgi:hypothetical protein